MPLLDTKITVLDKVYTVDYWMPGDPVITGSIDLSTDTETEWIIKGSPIKPVIAQVCDLATQHVQVVWYTLWPDYFAQLNAANPTAEWTFHNAPFDIKVLGDPRLPENSWLMKLLDANRITDTGVRFALTELTLGKYMGRWGLDYAAERRLGLKVDKGKGKKGMSKEERAKVKAESERMTFKQTNPDGTPWNITEPHIIYAAKDAIVTALVKLSMPMPLPTEEVCLLGNIALEDIADTGMLVDSELRTKHLAEYEERVRRSEDILWMFGWNSGTGYQNTAATNDMMEFIEQGEDLVLPRTKGTVGKPAYTDEDGVFHKEVITKPGNVQMTDAALEALTCDHRFINTIKEYKHDAKIISTYLSGNSTDIDGNEVYDKIGVDGRVHPNFKGIMKTGRTSCGKPNLQNLPREGGIRGIYKAPPGKLYFACDYSQAELCCLAQDCYTRFGFSRMLEVINDGVDIHLWLGERIYYKENNVPITDIMALSNFTEKSLNEAIEKGNIDLASRIQSWLALTGKERKSYRQLSKSLNFGAPGGLGAAKFVEFAKNNYKVVVSIDEARELIDFWKEKAFPEIARHLDLSSDGTITIKNDLGEDEVKDVFRASTITGRYRAKASFCSAANFSLTSSVKYKKPSEFRGSQPIKVILSESLQECKARATTSRVRPERTINYHERPARRNAVMI